MDLRTLFYRTFMSSVIVFFFTIVVFLFILEFALRTIANRKEALEPDHLQLAIHAIRSAQRDSRLSASQKQALQNALYYADHIKNL